MATTPTRPTPQGTLWVCTTCLLVRESTDVDEDWCSCGHTPWEREPTTDVTIGLLAAEHECGGAWERDGECDCERIEFSPKACDACGCHLAGTRHAYTWWADLAATRS